jgi:hypothetical protein
MGIARMKTNRIVKISGRLGSRGKISKNANRIASRLSIFLLFTRFLEIV